MDTNYQIYTSELSVRPDDIDMHQHVRSSRYLDYVLAARLDQMERCYGMPMEAFLERGLTWFVKTAHVNHHRALKMGDRMRIRTGIKELHARGVTVVWEILRSSDERLVADGYCLYTLVHRETARPQRLPEDVRTLYTV